MKKVNNFFKDSKDSFSIPKNVQEVIPIYKIYEDGIFEVVKNKYSKCFKFTDINYCVASKEDKEKMLLDYCDILKTLSPGVNFKITILNRKYNEVDFNNGVLIKEANDKLDMYRKEYNNILKDKSINSNSIIQEKYLTLSMSKDSIEEARTSFTRIESSITILFNQLGSFIKPLSINERIKLFHDFYRQGEEENFNWSMLEDMKKGHSFKDYICPDGFSFCNNYFEMGNQFGRVFLIKDYATYLKDDLVSEITELNKNILLSIDGIPIPTEVAIREAENRKLGVETNIANWQRRQNTNNNFSAVIPYNMEQQRAETKEFLDDILTRDQRVYLTTFTIVLLSKSLQELESDTESLISIISKHSCQIATLKYQQMPGLNTVLPSGIRLINSVRTLTSEGLAALIPFRVQEVNHVNGIYYGQNVISKNMITINRNELLNGNSFILGISGSGKSFAAKNEIVSLALRDPNADIIVIDPEREYTDLVDNLGGQVIKISATSNNHVNAFDINDEYGENNNPIILKSEFLLSFYQIIIGGMEVEPSAKSIIDRCTASTYRNCLSENRVPTLKDFQNELLKQPEEEAHLIALKFESFVTGSYNTFAQETNVDINNRIVCYDILELENSLINIGMLVILDSILNRITRNRKLGKSTYIFIDEIYLLFRYEYSSNFLFKLWKRVRKYGAFCTGITQNVQDLLCSQTARTMLSNSELIVMLNQATSDRKELAKLLNISDSQLSYITNTDAGEGLIKVGKSLVPFKNDFPKNTMLYKLMTTDPKDKHV